MHCPFCKCENSRVIDSRVVDQGSAIRRRRECPECKGRFTTMEQAVLLVLKRNGLTEPFSREKVIRGVRRACQGRSVSEDSLKKLAQEVELAVRQKGSSQMRLAKRFCGRSGISTRLPTYDSPRCTSLSTRLTILKRKYGSLDVTRGEKTACNTSSTGRPSGVGFPGQACVSARLQGGDHLRDLLLGNLVSGAELLCK